MRFAHLADTHLGFRQYGLSEREEDFYQAFEDVIAKIIQERPDFVVHSGDLFDFHRPQPRALLVAQKCFRLLQERGIPVFTVTGNHDVVLRRGAMPPQVLFSNFGVRMLTEDEPFIVHKDVFIGGSPYRSRYYANSLLETLEIIAKKSSRYSKSVLVLHQGIDKFLPQEFELKLEEVPKNFNYVAMGHIHSRILQDFGRGKLAYPGSTEMWSVNEYEDYRKHGKGFFLVDLHGDEPDVQPVEIELSRKIIRERINAAALNEKLALMKRSYSEMKSRPLVYLDVTGDGFERSALQEKLVSQLSDIVLSLRVSYLSPAAERATAGALARHFSIPDMIAIALKDKHKAGLAEALFRSLSENDEEGALEAAENFYGDVK